MTTNIIDLELTEAELASVVGGDLALQHEAPHASAGSNGGPPPVTGGGVNVTIIIVGGCAK
jgi:hypothetical protein